MKTLAEPAYWSEMWERCKLEYHPNSITFKDLFDRHLPTGGDCFEVGCYPGGYLIYLSKRFRYRVHGIDMFPGVDSDLPGHLARNGALVGELTHGDFFSFVPPMQYDVVCSFGFVEHFANLPEVLRCHAELVKPGGLLLITCPNFRRVQFFLHWLLDRANLKKHVLDTMDLKVWTRSLESLGLTVMERGYYKTFDFWVEPADRGGVASWLATKIRKWGSWIDRRFHCPNRFSSPFLFCICRKPRPPEPETRGGVRLFENETRAN